MHKDVTKENKNVILELKSKPILKAGEIHIPIQDIKFNAKSFKIKRFLKRKVNSTLIKDCKAFVNFCEINKKEVT